MSEQRKALEASIAHWEDVVEQGLTAQIGIRACPLCRVYNNDATRESLMACTGCPIVTTGLGDRYCIGTPYNEVMQSRLLGDFIYFDVHARRELAFLKEVLAALPFEGENPHASCDVDPARASQEQNWKRAAEAVNASVNEYGGNAQFVVHDAIPRSENVKPPKRISRALYIAALIGALVLSACLLGG